MNTKTKQFLAGAAMMLVLLIALVLVIPATRERLINKWTEVRAQIKYAINPPEKVIFSPNDQVAAAVRQTMTAMAASFTATPAPSATSIPSTLLPSATPTITPTPLPGRVELKGIRYTNQHGAWNYCAPANLAMALSFWGWKGDREDTASVLKPYSLDKNVMPYEMQNFVQDKTDLKAVIRVGGDIQMIKAFLAGGFPVLIEQGEALAAGEFGSTGGWLGHYLTINGYDDSQAAFIAQDSLRGPDQEVPYDGFESLWRDFNYIYMVIYPADKESTVMQILGPQADETSNYQYAALKAANEIEGLTGRDQFFAYFNRGTNLDSLQDYNGAAAAYDNAYVVYPTIPEADRPYRMIWYQTGPYYAYYFTGRYWDVINLATSTLDAMSDPMLEESYYWRARAELALNDTAGAERDIRLALKYHQGFEPAIELRAQMNN
jgi:hypothetical protein